MRGELLGLAPGTGALGVACTKEPWRQKQLQGLAQGNLPSLILLDFSYTKVTCNDV